MTAELNRQRVLNLLNVFYSGDIEGTLARCTDDIEFASNAPVDLLPHLRRRHGNAAMREMWSVVQTRYSEMRCGVPIMVAEGDQVAANFRVFFRKRSNQRMAQFDIAAFFTLRDGLIAEIGKIIDSFDLIEQVLERNVSAVLTGKLWIPNVIPRRCEASNPEVRDSQVRNCVPWFASSKRPGMTAIDIYPAPLNLAAPSVTHHNAACGQEEHMKIALLALLGLALGALGGAALGIGAGLAWVEIFKTTSIEGYSGMLVFFTFMPLGAAIGGIGGALLFGVIAIREAEIAVEREPLGRR
jgi:ketosteroid isomerase-like protein